MYTNPRILYNSQDPKTTKSCFQLQNDRSSRLFGVRSWDRYHVKAHTLNFHIKKKFSFSTIFRSSNLTKTKRLWIRFRINFTVWSPFEMRMFAIFPRFIARYETYPICKTGATSVRVRSRQPLSMGSIVEIKSNNHNKKQSAQKPGINLLTIGR